MPLPVLAVTYRLREVMWRRDFRRVPVLRGCLGAPRKISRISAACELLTQVADGAERGNFDTALVSGLTEEELN
jgi:hypothetical protein